MPDTHRSWVPSKKGNNGLSRRCTLLGHDAPITALALSSNFQTVVSGSSDGFISQWDMTGKYVRGLQTKGSIDRLEISNEGIVVLYSADTCQLIALDLNGNFEGNFVLEKGIGAMKTTEQGRVLVAGDEGGRVLFFRLGDLKLLLKLETSVTAPIRSLSFLREKGKEKYVVAGTEDGALIFVPAEFLSNI
jgi:WD40 repeat protein